MYDMLPENGKARVLNRAGRHVNIIVSPGPVGKRKRHPPLDKGDPTGPMKIYIVGRVGPLNLNCVAGSPR